MIKWVFGRDSPTQQTPEFVDPFPPELPTPVSAQSVRISANLEALLQDDDDDESIQSLPSSLSRLGKQPMSPLPGAEGLFGLPPPPRGPRKTRSREIPREHMEGGLETLTVALNNLSNTHVDEQEPAKVKLPPASSLAEGLGFTFHNEHEGNTGSGQKVQVKELPDRDIHTFFSTTAQCIDHVQPSFGNSTPSGRDWADHIGHSSGDKDLRVSRTSSSSEYKPPLPTTPKPKFRRSLSAHSSRRVAKSSISEPLVPSPRPSQYDQDFTLPPTTNFLNSQERADLIRRNRKLTQLLGQVPSVVPPADLDADAPDALNCLLPVKLPKRSHNRSNLSVSHGINRPQIPLRKRTISLHDEVHRIGHFNSTPFVGRYPENDASADFDEHLPNPSPSQGTSNSTLYDQGADMDLQDEEQPSTSERDRKRKREQLAKLHRFLGSRVPNEVLGLHHPGVPLPPFSDADRQLMGEAPSSVDIGYVGRKGSLPSNQLFRNLEPLDRKPGDLSDREKAVNVKRALKMEKLFGEQPPQSLFHTRQGLPPRERTSATLSTDTSSHRSSAPSSPVLSNVNRSAYLKGKKSNTGSNKGSTESLDKLDPPHPLTQIYLSYRNSLNSLTEMLDKDDLQSIVDLHDYMTTEHSDQSLKVIKNSRRRSLPLHHRRSTSSLGSKFTTNMDSPDPSSFQVRRRRVEKLTHFFGVAYRDILSEVLDNIEMGVREEEGRGSLRAEEVQELLSKLRSLKSRREFA